MGMGGGYGFLWVFWRMLRGLKGCEMDGTKISERNEK